MASDGVMVEVGVMLEIRFGIRARIKLKMRVRIRFRIELLCIGSLVAVYPQYLLHISSRLGLISR